MRTTVQTRLDDKTREILDALVKRKGWTASDVLRKGIHLVAREAEEAPRIRIHGLGEFDFGVSDLSTNKKYMVGFGGSSFASGKRRRKIVDR
jgi:hypothetical protein